MVCRPEDYRGSSYRGRMGFSELCEADVAQVQDGIRGSRPTAQTEFVRALERKLQRQIEPQRRERPSEM